MLNERVVIEVTDNGSIQVVHDRIAALKEPIKAVVKEFGVFGPATKKAASAIDTITASVKRLQTAINTIDTSALNRIRAEIAKPIVTNHIIRSTVEQSGGAGSALPAAAIAGGLGGATLASQARAISQANQAAGVSAHSTYMKDAWSRARELAGGTKGSRAFLGQAMKETMSDLQAAKQVVETFTGSIRTLISALGSGKPDLHKLSVGIGELDKSLQTIPATVTNFSNALKSLKPEEIKNIAASITELVKALKSITLPEKIITQLDKLTTSAKNASAESDKFRGSLVKLSRSSKTTESELSKLHSTIGKFDSKGLANIKAPTIPANVSQNAIDLSRSLTAVNKSVKTLPTKLTDLANAMDKLEKAVLSQAAITRINTLASAIDKLGDKATNVAAKIKPIAAALHQLDSALLPGMIAHANSLGSAIGDIGNRSRAAANQVTGVTNSIAALRNASTGTINIQTSTSGGGASNPYPTGARTPSSRTGDPATGSIQAGLAGVGSAIGLQQLATLADTWSDINGLIAIATHNEEEATQTQTRLYEISQRTRMTLSDVVGLYAKVQRAQSTLQASNEEIFRFVEGIGQALVVQHVGTKAVRGALTQLGQLLGMQNVRAQEFKSIMEQTPVVIHTVASQYPGIEGSVAALQSMMSNKSQIITSRAFFHSFLAGMSELQEKMDKAAFTIGQSFTIVENSMIKFAGQMNELTGASDLFGKQMRVLSNNAEVLASSLAIIFAPAIIYAFTIAVSALFSVVAAHPVGALIIAVALLVNYLTAAAGQSRLFRTVLGTLYAIFKLISPVLSFLFNVLKNIVIVMASVGAVVLMITNPWIAFGLLIYEIANYFVNADAQGSIVMVTLRALGGVMLDLLTPVRWLAEGLGWLLGGLVGTAEAADTMSYDEKIAEYRRLVAAEELAAKSATTSSAAQVAAATQTTQAVTQTTQAVEKATAAQQNLTAAQASAATFMQQSNLMLDTRIASLQRGSEIAESEVAILKIKSGIDAQAANLSGQEIKDLRTKIALHQKLLSQYRAARLKVQMLEEVNAQLDRENEKIRLRNEGDKVGIELARIQNRFTEKKIQLNAEELAGIRAKIQANYDLSQQYKRMELDRAVASEFKTGMERAVMSKEQRAVESAMDAIKARYTSAGLELSAEQLAAIRSQVVALRQLEAAQEKQKKPVKAKKPDTTRADLDRAVAATFEREAMLIKLTSREREISNAVYAIEQKYRQKGITLTSQELAGIRAKVEAQKSLVDQKNKAELDAKVNAELARSAELLRMTSEERKISNSLRSIEQQYQSKGLTLSAAELASIRERIVANQQLGKELALAADRKKLDSEVAANFQRANELLRMNDEQRAVSNALYAIEQQYKHKGITLTKDEIAAIRAKIEANRELEQSQAQIKLVNEAVMNAMSSMITTFAATGKLDFASFASSVISDLQRIAIQIYILKPLLDSLNASTMGGSVGGYGSIFSGMMGFANGGSIIAGSGGGPDSHILVSRVSPGERIDFTPAGKQRNDGGQNITINITTPDVEGFKRSQSQVAAISARMLAQGRRNQ